MSFYYLNLPSLLFLATIYAIALLLLWLFWVKGLGRDFKGPVVSAVVVAILIAPWSEEFWIAYHFDKVCKEAGTFIYKKVRVDGFYDDTMGWGPRQLSEHKYQFVESKDVLHKTLSRVERADDLSRDRALALYAQRNPAEQLSKNSFVVRVIDDNEQIAVSPNGVEAWRIIKIDRPTARYHYTWPDRNANVSHKLYKQLEELKDMKTGEVLGRSLHYGRLSSWFFIALDDPGMTCPSPVEQQGVLLYRLVLEPATAR